MDDIASIAGKLAGIISLAAYVPYILSILRKETKPNRASWIIWAIVSSIVEFLHGRVSGVNDFFSWHCDDFCVVDEETAGYGH